MTADREAAIRAKLRSVDTESVSADDLEYASDLDFLLAELAAAREEIEWHKATKQALMDAHEAAVRREEKLREALLMLRHDPEYADWTTKGQRRIVDEALEISAEGGTTGHGTAAAATAGSDGEGAPSQSEVGADTALSEGES